jgi:hypothetical protein
LKPENMLIRRRDQFIAVLKEQGWPFVLAYTTTFGMEGEPLRAYVHGAGKEIRDVDILLTILGQAAYRNLGIQRQEMTPFTDSCSIRTGDPEPEVTVTPGVVVEEDCSS